MAGILDSKSRIMDVIITDQGRRQIASGQMRIEYATFTDVGAFYSGNEDGVIEDPSSRIYFEAVSDLPSDLVTFETDDSGFLIPYRSDNFGASGKNLVISGSLKSENSNHFAASSISSAIFESWKNLQAIGTNDPLDDNQSFQLSRSNLEFGIREDFPFTSNDVKNAVIDDIESLNHDFRLSGLSNFKYMPPINSRGALAGQTIGNFPNDNEFLDSDKQALENRISKLEFAEVDFVETSIENNFLMQIFEVSDDEGMIKLDVIDYGEKPSRRNDGGKVRVLFAGKILQDRFGNPTFVNIFTLEIE